MADPARHVNGARAHVSPCVLNRMTLPFELVDEIITHLQHDKRALQNCSLVAKSWTYPSQKLLFASIVLTPEIYKKRQENGPPSSAVLQHVRTLTCHRFSLFGVLQGDFLKSLHRLQDLALYGRVHIDPIAPNQFLAFQDTLSSLTLYRVSLTRSTFICLIAISPTSGISM